MWANFLYSMTTPVVEMLGLWSIPLFFICKNKKINSGYFLTFSIIGLMRVYLQIKIGQKDTKEIILYTVLFILVVLYVICVVIEGKTRIKKNKITIKNERISDIFLI